MRSVELRGSEASSEGADNARLHIMKQSGKHFNKENHARRLKKEEAKEEGPDGLEIVTSVLAVIVSQIVTLVIPSKLGEYIAMGLEDLEALVECVRAKWIE